MQTSWQKSHREELRLYKANWRKKHPDKVRAQKARSYVRHTQKIKEAATARYRTLKNDPQFKRQKREQLRRWRAKNWEHFLQDARERQQRSRREGRPHHKAADYRHYTRRRASKAQAQGTHTDVQWKARIKFFGWRCVYCNVALTVASVTKDHRIPLSKGGTDFAANLVPACRPCNSRKRDRRR